MSVKDPKTREMIWEVLSWNVISNLTDKFQKITKNQEDQETVIRRSSTCQVTGRRATWLIRNPVCAGAHSADREAFLRSRCTEALWDYTKSWNPCLHWPCADHCPDFSCGVHLNCLIIQPVSNRRNELLDSRMLWQVWPSCEDIHQKTCPLL
jgi:hypothetical protein